MYSGEAYLTYSIIVFVIVLISGCILNLLRQHYIFQLAGIAFLFTYMLFRSISMLTTDSAISSIKLYTASLPVLMGIAACLVSMVLGFWVFPPIRNKIRD